MQSAPWSVAKLSLGQERGQEAGSTLYFSNPEPVMSSNWLSKHIKNSWVLKRYFWGTLMTFSVLPSCPFFMKTLARSIQLKRHCCASAEADPETARAVEISPR